MEISLLTEYDPPAPMTEEQKTLIDQENHWRNLFFNNPENDELRDPHLGLVSVYDNLDKFQFEDETPEEKKIPKLLGHNYQPNLSGQAVVDKSQFLKNWEEITQGCLEGLDWTNVFVAGGSILGCLSSNQDGYRGSDIDIFIWGIKDEAVANQKIKDIYGLIVRNTQGKGDILRTNRAFTILCAYPFRHVQIIARLYYSPGQVLLGFDIDSCCVGFDGENIWAMERFRRALTKRYNLLNVSRRSNTYEQRLFKYSKRGFAVAVPDLDKKRINPNLFQKNIRDGVTGMAKLLIYDYNVNTGRPNFYRPGRRGRAPRDDQEEGSDYNNDLPIPWGPDWQTEKIIQLVNIKNKAKFFATLRKNKKQEAQGENPPPLAYNHLFTCNAQKLESADWKMWKRSLDGVEVEKPLEWIKDNPAYQDFDNGFRRLMTGSFETAIENDWMTGVYLEDGEEPTIPLRGISHNRDLGNKSYQSKHQDLPLLPSPSPPKEEPYPRARPKKGAKPGRGRRNRLRIPEEPEEPSDFLTLNPNNFDLGGFGNTHGSFASSTAIPRPPPLPGAMAALGLGFGATGFGSGFDTTGFGSTAGGLGSTAGGFGSTTGGFGSTLGGFGATGGGWTTTGGFDTTGFGSTTGGLGSTAGGFGSTAGGFGSTVGGFGSTTGGFGPTLGGFGNSWESMGLPQLSSISYPHPPSGLGISLAQPSVPTGVINPQLSSISYPHPSSGLGISLAQPSAPTGVLQPPGFTPAAPSTGLFPTQNIMLGSLPHAPSTGLPPQNIMLGSIPPPRGKGNRRYGDNVLIEQATSQTNQRINEITKQINAIKEGFGAKPTATRNVACDFCKVRHLRCDGQEVCFQCQKRQQKCIYTTSFSFTGAPEVVSISEQNLGFKEEREKGRRKRPPATPFIAPTSTIPSQMLSGPLGFGATPTPTTTPFTNMPVASTPTTTSSKSSTTKLLLLVSLAFKKGNITAQEKGKLKDLIILGNPIVISALEVFEIDQDFDELIDTFKRISKLQ